MKERQEIGSRAILLRISMFNYPMNWLARPIFNGESIRTSSFHESTPGEVDRMEQQIHYVIGNGKPNNKTTHAKSNTDMTH